jgi:alpha-ketoglutaric semialdehyde dehydrogenase
MSLLGVSLIGSKNGSAGAVFHGMNPATGASLEPPYSTAGPFEVELAARLAHEAFPLYSALSGAQKGDFLRRIAAAIESNGPAIVERAQLETALPKPRLDGELARTCNQLRLFAQVVEEGSWVNARIDLPDPSRKPLPKPDIRSILRPLGPVAVFGASNFPLAFSVAGGDTASALAAGNPVIVKAHPAHPGTSELVGHAVREAVRACELPGGAFSLLFDSGIEVGTALVQNPLVKAVGFTGSAVAGKALMKLAAARPVPIPCYAEMGSANPVFVLPGAMRARPADIATGLHNSFTLGGGQFCTKPGLVFVPQEGAELFTTELSQRVQTTPLPVMLTKGIADKYAAAVQQRNTSQNVRTIAQSKDNDNGSTCAGAIALFATDTASFLEYEDLAEEIFGPSTLLVHYQNHAELLEIADKLEGHLTATLHGSEEDIAAHRDLIAILENKAGRILFNGYPTGVEVCHAMVHGGPYPATSDGRSTSVGSQAIFRFVRPVCYQNFSGSALPDELKDENPLGIMRVVDGTLTRERARSQEKRAS